MKVGDKVRVSQEAMEYVGRPFASIGIICGNDSEGDFLVKTRITQNGRHLRWSDTGIWVKPKHIKAMK